MEFRKRDVKGPGFYVPPELLSHDLALLKVQLSENFKTGMNDCDLYELYVKELASIRAMINDKTRDDSVSR